MLRPTFEAMVAIEEQIGALTVITQRLRSGAGALTLTETAVIITECMKAHGRATKNQLAANARAESVAKMIFAAGVVQIVPVIFPLLTKMLTGGATADEGNG
ncbi:MAG: hypothetical protein MUE77_12205 [Sandarakinorhabdus sp.]|nr:hypothetical protein [Sandarakinorhabdus sp.]